MPEQQPVSVEVLRGALQEEAMVSSLRGIVAHLHISTESLRKFIDGRGMPSPRAVAEMRRWYDAHRRQGGTGHSGPHLA